MYSHIDFAANDQKPNYLRFAEKVHFSSESGVGVCPLVVLEVLKQDDYVTGSKYRKLKKNCNSFLQNKNLSNMIRQMIEKYTNLNTL